MQTASYDAFFLRIDFCQKVIKRKNVTKGGKNLKIFPKPMAKRTKSTSSSKVLHKLVPRRRRNSMLFYSSWWGLIDTKISQKTPTPGIDDSLFKSIVMRIPMFIPMTRTVSEFHKEIKYTILNCLKPFISAYFPPNTSVFNVRDKYK